MSGLALTAQHRSVTSTAEDPCHVRLLAPFQRILAPPGSTLSMQLTAAVVAVQGDVTEHAAAVRRAGAAHGHEVEVCEVRQSGHVPDADLLLMPGGESTTISRHLCREGIAGEIRDHVAAGKPVLATCAGLIVAARDAKDDRVDELGLLDVTVDRNAFGRQTDSFEAPLDVTGLGDPFPAVFIRAPLIDGVGEGVEVLATWDDRPVAVRDGPVFGTSFHPELTDDPRIHALALFESETATLPRR
jgi:5'-phosphate synthase pdxT subunit